ncbi:Gfo/Idh/MocA family protein [Roseibacillus persicicus]|uniref:Gfo/Idh/MocA family protein n=1 Tax=Roseibacillus persicicus TaxID=454148 RepID=UPI0035EA3AC9
MATWVCLQGEESEGGEVSTNQPKQPLRIGFIGAARIAGKNWKAIYHSGTCVVKAVAARDKSKAGNFIETHQAEFSFEEAPTAYGDYSELLDSPEIDAVYVPLPTALRKEWVIKAAQAGKHVICEKPCAVTAKDLREMIEACRENQVQFMDGVMFMHSPRLEVLRKLLEDEQRIGPIRRISSEFTFLAGDDFDENIRVNADLEPAGCLGDLGWYNLRVILFAMQWQLPSKVSAHTLAVADDGKTPTAFSGELFYSNGVSGSFYCSFDAELQQWANICGQKGTVSMKDFIHPWNSYEPAFEINRIEHRVTAGPEVKVPANPHVLGETGQPWGQDTRMFQNFAKAVFSGTLNEDWPAISLKTQLILDACLASAEQGGELVAVAG